MLSPASAGPPFAAALGCKVDAFNVARARLGLTPPVALCPAVLSPEFCTGEELSRKPATNLALTMALILLGF